MKRILALLSALVVCGVAWAQPVIPLTQHTLPLSFSSTTTQVLVSGGTAPNLTSIYVTHWDLAFTGAGSIQWLQGAGASCSGGASAGAVTGLYSFSAQGQGIAVGSGSGVIIALSPGYSLCAQVGGGISAGGLLSYAQF